MRKIAVLALLLVLTGCTGAPSFGAWQAQRPIHLSPLASFKHDWAPSTILVAPDGGLWLGHVEGFSKVQSDGTVLFSDNSLAISHMALDQAGRCWVSSQFHTLSTFSSTGALLSRKAYSSDNPNPGDGTFFPIMVARDNRVWAKHVDHGLETLAPDMHLAATVANKSSIEFRVDHIIESPTGDVWLVGGGGLKHLAANGADLGTFLLDHHFLPTGGADSQGNLWVSQLKLFDKSLAASENKLLKVSPTGVVTHASVSGQDVSQVAVDRTGCAWAAISDTEATTRLEKFAPDGTSLGAINLDGPLTAMTIEGDALWLSEFKATPTPHAIITRYAI